MKYPTSSETSSFSSRYYKTYSWNKTESDTFETNYQELNKETFNALLSTETSPDSLQQPDVEWKSSFMSHVTGGKEILEITNLDEEKNTADTKSKELIEVSACFEEKVEHSSEQSEYDHVTNDTMPYSTRIQTPLAIAAKSVQSHVTNKLVVLKKFLTKKIVDYVAPSCSCCIACQSSHEVSSCSPCSCPCQSIPCCITSCQTICQQSCIPRPVCPCSFRTCPPSCNSFCHHYPENTNYTHNLDNRSCIPCHQNQSLVSPPYHLIKTNHKKTCASNESDSAMTDSCNSSSDNCSSRNNRGNYIENVRSQSFKRHKKKLKYKEKRQEMMLENKNLTKCSRYHNMRRPEYDHTSNKIFLAHMRAENAKKYEKKLRASRNSTWIEKSYSCCCCRRPSIKIKEFRPKQNIKEIRPKQNMKQIHQKENSPFRVYFHSHHGSGFHCSNSRKQRNKRIFSSKTKHTSSSRSMCYDLKGESDVYYANIRNRKKSVIKKPSLYDSGFNESSGYSQKDIESNRNVRNGHSKRSSSQKDSMESNHNVRNEQLKKSSCSQKDSMKSNRNVRNGQSKRSCYSQKDMESNRNVRNGQSKRFKEEDVHMNFIEFHTRNPDIFKFSESKYSDAYSQHSSPEHILNKSKTISNNRSTIRRVSFKQPLFLREGISCKEVSRSNASGFRFLMDQHRKRSQSLYSNRHRSYSYHDEDYRTRNKSKKIIKMKICRKE